MLANRLQTYYEQTAAVTGYYRGRENLVINIDAGQPADDVTSSIFAELDKIGCQVD